MEKPSYYAVIPAPVRYSNVSANAKLLYGEITCLCESEGFCWASNGYLAKLYDAGERTVSRWLFELEKAGFIRIEPAVNQHGQRRIFIEPALPKVASQKWQAKNGEHNNTREENTTSKRTAPIAPKGAAALVGFDQFWQAYPRKVGKPKALAAWKRLKPDTAVVLDAVRRWKSSDQWLKDDGQFIPHPTTWLNREGWNDAIAGEKVAPSADELKAAQDRIDAQRRANEERERLMVEDRRRQLGLTA